eukprot:scaffold19489_cov110-Isochrysis_galbana.AAC.7
MCRRRHAFASPPERASAWAVIAGPCPLLASADGSGRGVQERPGGHHADEPDQQRHRHLAEAGGLSAGPRVAPLQPQKAAEHGERQHGDEQPGSVIPRKGHVHGQRHQVQAEHPGVGQGVEED